MEPLSCVACRSRKIKCDRVSPACSRCSRSGQKCEYPERRRKQPVKWMDIQRLETRLEHMQGLLLQYASRQQPQRQSAPGVQQPPPEQRPLPELQPPHVHRPQPASRPGLAAVPSPSGAVLMETGNDLFEAETGNDLSEAVEGGTSGRDPIPEGLPSPEELEEMVNVCLRGQANGNALVHPGNYRQALSGPPNMRPPVCLGYSMAVFGSLAKESHHKYTDRLYHHAVHCIDEDELEASDERPLTVAHAIALFLLLNWEGKRYGGQHAASTTNRLIRLCVMMGLHQLDVAPPQQAVLPLPPPRNWGELEERRRIFWVAFGVDCVVSMSTDQPPMIDHAAITTRLPCSEEAFFQNREEVMYRLHDIFYSSQGLADTFNNPDMPGLTLTGNTLTSYLFQQVTEHSAGGYTAADRPDDFETGRFWQRHRDLDAKLSGVFLYMHPTFRLPKNISDPMAVQYNMNLHASVIILQRTASEVAVRYKLPGTVKATCWARLVTAAQAILDITALSSQVPGSVTKSDPYISKALYHALRVYLAHTSDTIQGRWTGATPCGTFSTARIVKPNSSSSSSNNNNSSSNNMSMQAWSPSVPIASPPSSSPSFSPPPSSLPHGPLSGEIAGALAGVQFLFRCLDRLSLRHDLARSFAIQAVVAADGYDILPLISVSPSLRAAAVGIPGADNRLFGGSLAAAAAAASPSFRHDRTRMLSTGLRGGDGGDGGRAGRFLATTPHPLNIASIARDSSFVGIPEEGGGSHLSRDKSQAQKGKGRLETPGARQGRSGQRTQMSFPTPTSEVSPTSAISGENNMYHQPASRNMAAAHLQRQLPHRMESPPPVVTAAAAAIAPAAHPVAATLTRTTSTTTTATFSAAGRGMAALESHFDPYSSFAVPDPLPNPSHFPNINVNVNASTNPARLGANSASFGPQAVGGSQSSSGAPWTSLANAVGAGTEHLLPGYISGRPAAAELLQMLTPGSSLDMFHGGGGTAAPVVWPGAPPPPPPAGMLYEDHRQYYTTNTSSAMGDGFGGMGAAAAAAGGEGMITVGQGAASGGGGRGGIRAGVAAAAAAAAIVEVRGRDRQLSDSVLAAELVAAAAGMPVLPTGDDGNHAFNGTTGAFDWAGIWNKQS